MREAASSAATEGGMAPLRTLLSSPAIFAAAASFERKAWRMRSSIKACIQLTS